MNRTKPNLIIYRESLRLNRREKYKVIIDGDQACRIKNGEKLGITLLPGKHNIYAKINLLKSNRVDFCIDDNNLINIVIGIKKPKFIASMFSFILLIGIVWLAVNLTEIFNNKLFLFVIIGGGFSVVLGYLTASPSIRKVEKLSTRVEIIKPNIISENRD